MNYQNSKPRNSDGRMNRVLRLLALITGVFLLVISIFWSQDGFNFNVAGQSGYGGLALGIGYILAIAVTVIQFVFSTNFKELNASLLLFGIIAYAYSIYTNYQGIVHFQGDAPNKVAAFFLGLCMDGVPEPLIAWALKESLSGDFVGNLLATLSKIAGSIMDGPEQPRQEKREQSSTPVTYHKVGEGPKTNNQQNQHQGKHKGSDRRHQLESQFRSSEKNLEDILKKFGE